MKFNDENSGLSLNDLSLDAGLDTLVWERRLRLWDEADIGSGIWRHDPGVWVENPAEEVFIPELSNRLGWLDLPEKMLPQVAEIKSFAEEVIAAGFSRAVVLGMGGSSLIVEVWAGIFGVRAGFLPVAILDSTHPLSVAGIAAAGELETTLFLVASKSGGTLETISFFNYFYHQLSLLKDNPGANFVALTDPGSKLEVLAREKHFRKIFSTPPAVGGRYSALTCFGLLPAMLLGVPVEKILSSARMMVSACGSGVPASENPALKLGAFLGEMVLAGHDKLVLLLSPSIKPFAVWLEQLIAESIGKSGYGLLPVIVEDVAAMPFHDDSGKLSQDCVYLFMFLEDDVSRNFIDLSAQLRRGKIPFAQVKLHGLTGLGQEIWRFEMAIAAAGAVLRINPFDQPDVEAAKSGTRQAMAARSENGFLPEPVRLVDSLALKISGSRHFSQVESLESALKTFIKAAQPGDYIVIMAYLPQTESLQKSLQELVAKLQKCCRVPVTIGFGPRFLHSTGQLHKGDGNKGLFLQLAGGLETDLKLPGEDYGFATLITAQAQGDYEALRSKDRRVLALSWLSGEMENAVLHLVSVVEKLCLGSNK
jgi:glucose-6-phosphate isomerase